MQIAGKLSVSIDKSFLKDDIINIFITVYRVDLT